MFILKISKALFFKKKCLRQNVFYQRRLNIINIVTLFNVFYFKKNYHTILAGTASTVCFPVAAMIYMYIGSYTHKQANTFQIHVVYRLSVICVIKQIHKL